MIIDDFITSFAVLRDYANHAVFKDELNAVDGVTYPLICRDIPAVVEREIIDKVQPKGEHLMFMRMSPLGCPVPHQAHTDNSMGSKSLMLYLNKIDDCQGGTSLLRHKATGISFAPEDQEFLPIIQHDQNNPSAWDAYFMAEMKPNRAFIFPSNMIHRAEPIGGFGDSNVNARIVLTCFYD